MKSLLQTSQWANFKEKQGWKIYNLDEIHILEKKLPLEKSFLYAPEIKWGDSTKVQKICENTKNIAEKSQTIFLRLEILDEIDDKIVANLKKLGFQKAFEEIQPEWRQVIDISKSEDEILAQMKPKGRYNIRVAQKHGIKIDQTHEVSDFFKLYQETSKRDKFEGRDQKYFEDLVESLKENNQVFIAKYQGKPIAGLIITFYDGVASYLYGASSGEHREVMAPYLAHWQAILEAKKRGCQTYDLLAIEPFKESNPQSDYRLQQNSEDGGRKAESCHKYSGITRFKEQFGGKKVHLIGSWDLVYKPVWYKLFKFAEQIRR